MTTRSIPSLRIAAILTVLAALASPAHAGILTTAKSWFSGEALALIASTAAALASGILGVLYAKAVRTFRETGEFLTVLGSALEDNRLTRDELAQIVREGRDIFRIWK